MIDSVAIAVTAWRHQEPSNGDVGNFGERPFDGFSASISASYAA